MVDCNFQLRQILKCRGHVRLAWHTFRNFCCEYGFGKPYLRLREEKRDPIIWEWIESFGRADIDNCEDWKYDSSLFKSFCKVWMAWRWRNRILHAVTNILFSIRCSNLYFLRLGKLMRRSCWQLRTNERMLKKTLETWRWAHFYASYCLPYLCIVVGPRRHVC